MWRNYCKACESSEENDNVNKGAILFAIARGKLTEGVDFSDRQCRCVAVCGIPYPPIHDPKVRLKKQFLTEHAICSAEEWYQQQASRAVNQTIGRVIRHKNDFGAVLLCDHRFEKSVNHLSNWLKPSMQVMGKYPLAYKKVREFFKGIEKGITPVITPVAEEYATPMLESTQNVAVTSMSSKGILDLPKTLNTAVDNALTLEASKVVPNTQTVTELSNKNDEKKVCFLDPDSQISVSDNFRAPLDKVNWMNCCQNLLDSADFQELTSSLMPELRENLQKLTTGTGSGSGTGTNVTSANGNKLKIDPLSDASKPYRETVQEIRNILLPAVSADSDVERLKRQRLIYNFVNFLHPKFRNFWKEVCVNQWAKEKFLGTWAEEIFSE